MSKYYGKIGYGITEETTPGVWKSIIKEREAYGDIFKNSKIAESSDKVVDNIKISNQISIIADPYAQQNFQNIKYATFMGTAWKVTSVEVQFPRLLLILGGVYNGE